MNLDWQNLRPFNNSLNNAFEELCSQLAEHEQVPTGSKYTRKGTPDAGVECFWKLPNGGEWGWQAKFFLSPPENSQWQQLDDSVRTALEKHPQLTSYTICLPIDRPDARIKGQKSCMQKWDEHEKKWTQWAKEKGMDVKFPYWGTHEIWERLSLEEHRGRRFFGSIKNFLTNSGFKGRLSRL